MCMNETLLSSTTASAMPALPRSLAVLVGQERSIYTLFFMHFPNRQLVVLI